jgi:anthranilate synthase/aminodeoxychorismate synthase-like glutamine amidotransferase
VVSAFVVDNYDSFTFNLVGALRLLGAQVSVARNDAVSVAAVLATPPDLVVISPGPGRPEHAGITLALVRECLARRTPLLGVCLGHQALGMALGGTVARGSGPMHGFSTPMEVARYHSLVLTEVPQALRVTARAEDGAVMAVHHRELPAAGVQFHPESFLTPSGPDLLANALRLATPRR